MDLPQGWFHEGDIRTYRKLVEAVPDHGTIIELGVWKGRSLCSVADIIQRKRLTVYAVDTFQGTPGEELAHLEAKEGNLQEIFEANMLEAGVRARVYAMTTHEAASLIHDTFDLIFIDADHSYAGVQMDISDWLPKCRGVIAGHDLNEKAVARAVNEAFPKVQSYLRPDGAIWWSNTKTEEPTSMNRKIDVIIPAYKAQSTIMRTLSSIMTQSILDVVSVTIVNDADGEGYAPQVEMFSPYMDIKEVTLETNGGPGVARQAGIDNTSLPYFTCIDADDTFAGAFALEILLKGMESDAHYHTVVGTFIEQRAELSFVSHSNDLVWMFGKLYTRAFIDKYKIRFNETRANEDNGFNTIIRLISSDTEKIMFLNEVVYYWHDKPDSITRVNNCEYAYNQSFPGFTDNMIYAIKHAKKKKPFHNYVDMWAIQIMAQLYLYYLQTCKRDPRFKEQNYASCLKYYKEVFAYYMDSMEQTDMSNIFAQTLTEQAGAMADIVPSQTIYQFIDELKQTTEAPT